MNEKIARVFQDVVLLMNGFVLFEDMEKPIKDDLFKITRAEGCRIVIEHTVDYVWCCIRVFEETDKQADFRRRQEVSPVEFRLVECPFEFSFKEELKEGYPQVILHKGFPRVGGPWGSFDVQKWGEPFLKRLMGTS